MLICSFPKCSNFALSEEMFEELEELFKSKLILPVTSFSQYVLLMTAAEQSKYNKKVSLYFGTDVAKTISSTPLQQIRTRESLVLLLIKYVQNRTGSTITTPGFGSTVYVYDTLIKKVIYTLNDYRLDDYQERVELNGTTQFVSRFDHFIIAMSKPYKVPTMSDTDMLSAISKSGSVFI